MTRILVVVALCTTGGTLGGFFLAMSFFGGGESFGGEADMPEWLVHIGDWAATIAAGGLALVGVLLGLGGITKQISAGQALQLAEFEDRDRRREQEVFQSRQVQVARLMVELQLQNQLLFDRDLEKMLIEFVEDTKTHGEPLVVPPNLRIYDASRIFEKMEPLISAVPAPLVPFYVRYMGLLHHELDRYFKMFEIASDIGVGSEENEIFSHDYIQNLVGNLQTLNERFAALILMLDMYLKAKSPEDLQSKLKAERAKLDTMEKEHRVKITAE